MFHAARTLTSFSFQESMLYILEKVFLPWVYGHFCLSPFWLKGKNYYFIEAAQTSLLDYDLIRLAWMEKLKIVQLYLFVGAPENQLRTNEGLVLQNRWMYDQVKKFVPTNWITEQIPQTLLGYPHYPKITKFCMLQLNLLTSKRWNGRSFMKIYKLHCVMNS